MIPLRNAAALLAGLALAAGAVSLGNWQTRRVEEKEASAAQLREREALAPVRLPATSQSPADLEFRRVVARGAWLPEQAIFLDNRTHDGIVGVQVVMPLRLSDSSAVLVDRGWTAKDPQDRARLPRVPTSPGEVEVAGRAVGHVIGFMELGNAAPPPIGGLWANLSLDAYRKASALDVLDVIVLQTSDAPDGLVRDWPQPGSGSEKNLGYALQWYCLAALSAGLTIWFGGRLAIRARNESRSRAGA